MNQHVDTIIDLRRYLVMTEGKMDPEAQRAMMNIERQGNPWGLSKKDRENWREQDETLRIPTVKEMKKRAKNSNTYSGSLQWGLMITAVKRLLWHLLV